MVEGHGVGKSLYCIADKKGGAGVGVMSLKVTLPGAHAF